MPDMPLEAVKANLAVLFKTDPSKVERLFSGQAAVIKSKLSSQEADKYIGALHRAGARAYKEPEHTSPTLSLVQTDEELAAADTQMSAVCAASSSRSIWRVRRSFMRVLRLREPAQRCHLTPRLLQTSAKQCLDMATSSLFPSQAGLAVCVI